MLPKREGMIKVKSEVPPVQLGSQGGVSGVRSEAEVDRSFVSTAVGWQLRDYLIRSSRSD